MKLQKVTLWNGSPEIHTATTWLIAGQNIITQTKWCQTSRMVVFLIPNCVQQHGNLLLYMTPSTIQNDSKIFLDTWKTSLMFWKMTKHHIDERSTNESFSMVIKLNIYIFSYIYDFSYIYTASPTFFGYLLKGTFSEFCTIRFCNTFLINRHLCSVYVFIRELSCDIWHFSLHGFHI